MSSDIAIKVERLSKLYRLYDKPHDRIKQSILPRLAKLVRRPKRQYFHEFEALTDVSFEIAKGETVGIVGRNGSGKSTLLQIICGTLDCTSGSVIVSGRIAALLELGAGFNPEFTGRENVRMNCALLGLSPQETEARFEDIVAFADIGDFVEQPVKTYSSGMYVRLAFAVNIVASPDIMVVDEALSVGDMGFQAKCMTAMRRIQMNGATILFVSHDTNAVRSLCSRAIYLERGRVQCIGTAAEVAFKYTKTIREEMALEERAYQPAAQAVEADGGARLQSTRRAPAPLFKRSSEFDQRVRQFRYGSGGARITYAELLDRDGAPLNIVEFAQEVRIAIYLETDVETELTCNYYITDEKKNFIVGCDPRLAGDDFLRCKPDGRYLLTYDTTLPLKAGAYTIDLELARPIVVDEKGEFLDVVDNAVMFRVMRRPHSQLWAQVYVENQYTCREL
jgi:lipopolysaccharide transport system ATP-binding protein